MNKLPYSKIIIGVPAYNEERYIGSVVLQAKQYADEVIVVDDGSNDRTYEVAKLAGATIVQHGENKGYGAAVQTILAQAKERTPDVLVLLDADSQHDPAEILYLVKPISEGFDLAIGSRRMRRSDIPTYRRAGQKVLSYLTAILARKKLLDTESGFRAFSRKAIAVLEPNEKGMAISAETVAEATAKGLKITEVPISAIYTEDGSTLNPVKHGLGNVNRILVMISERRPLLFFGLGGSMCILLGIAAGVLVVKIIFASHVLHTGTALISIMLITIGILCIFTGVILNVLVRRIGDSIK